MEAEYYEGCGHEGPIRCILLCEFHPVAGPKILCQIPNGYISKDIFESVNVYIIPKAQLVRSVLTITVFGFKILGFPVRIDDNNYPRNAFNFNLCFVFDSWARTVQYEPVVKKLTDYLTAMELEKRFLSQLYCHNKKTQLIKMLTQVMDDLNTKKMCILSDGNSLTYLKVIELSADPQKVLDHHVPVIKEPLESFQLDQWDLTTNQILPYINGVNHVAKISASADVDNSLVKSCLQNLIFYGLVAIIPIFQYSNTYTTTCKLRNLALNAEMQEDCVITVCRTGKQLPSFRDVFQFYSSMKYGVTMKDLCIRFNPTELHIDERSLVQFGIVQGLIRKIDKYPVLMEHNVEDVPHSQYYNGEYSTDEICCITGMSMKDLEEQLEAYPNITFISK